MENAMIKRLLLSTMPVFAVVLFLGANTRLMAHSGHAHKVLGTVTMAAVDHVMLKDKAGKELTIKVTKDTQIKSKSPVKVEELKAGTRVVVRAIENKDKTMTAKTIEVGVAP
jgi:hypothetical protein